MSKDYIIFEHAPIITFNTTDPFTCEGNFNNVSAWYSSQTRNTKKPRPKVFGTIDTECSENSFNLQGISANISVHGNYTAYYRQKSFKLHLDTPQNLFGLNKGAAAKDWILLADYGDNSKLRNALALYMGQQFFRSTWSATFTLVHVYIDNEYYGLYLLTDAKEVAPTRVNVNIPEENYQGVDIGYFFERDDYLTYDAKDPGFIISYPDEYLPEPLPKIYHETNKSYGVDATYTDEYSISSKIYSQDQINFLKKYLCLIYTILYEACINSKYYELNSDDINNWQNWALVKSNLSDPITVVSKVIDINSFIDVYLLHEIAGNPDVAHSSFYFSLDMSELGDKKLRLSSPWDFDRAFGISNGLMNADMPRLWLKDAHLNPWVSLLPQTDWFINLLKLRYNELASNSIFNKCLNLLDDYSTTYETDFAQNYTKYNIRWEGDGWGWSSNGNPARIGTLNASYYENITAEAEAKALLKTWVNNRISALNTVFNAQAPSIVPQVTQNLKAPVITFTCNEHIADWYSSTKEQSERVRLLGTLSTSHCDAKFSLQDVKADIRVRGNYTANYSKKPFQIRFDKKQNLFGLNNGNKFKKWILLAEYNDSSMLRNALAFYMSKQIMGDRYWVPDFTFAHFYIQDSGTLYYMGLYLLVDQKEQDKDRVNVFKPADGYEGTDIGYFFERDDYFRTETDPTFTINIEEYQPVAPMNDPKHESNQWGRQANGVAPRDNQGIICDGFSIKSKITNNAQVLYLKNRLVKIYELLYKAVYNNEYYELTIDNNLVLSHSDDPYTVLSKTINIESFVNRYILDEICCNPDLAHSSFYMTLDMSATGNKLLTLDCPWDFDLALGIHRQFATDPVQAGLWAAQCTLNPWISLLAHTTWFMQLVKQRWQELYTKFFCFKNLKLLADQSTTYINDFAVNFAEWDINWDSNMNRTWNIDLGQTPIQWVKPEYYQENITSEADCLALLETWLTARFTTLHTLFGGQGLPDWYLTKASPNKNGIFICTREASTYTLQQADIFGAVRLIVGEKASNENIAKIIYDLGNKKINERKNFIRLDLETGGSYNNELAGYRNWFPGATAYGFIRDHDTNIYDENNHQLFDANGNALYVPAWAGYVSKEDATVEILDILDGVSTHPTLKAQLRLKYHIKTNSGVVGYIEASAVSDIVYRVKN